MFGVLAGPEFNSPDRRPTTSLGILGAVQKQAVSVIKARLPADGLAVRKKAAGVGAPADYICGFDNVDPILFDVLPNELVFAMNDDVPDDSNMESFVSSHQVHGRQFLTGDIQVEGFTALNGLPRTAWANGKLVFIGVATSSQIQKNGIDGFAVQVSGSVTINNAGSSYICAGDWVTWAPPATPSPSFTVVGVPPQKALACISVYNILENLAAFDAITGNFAPAAAGGHPETSVIGRALTNATQCQEFDIMLHG